MDIWTFLFFLCFSCSAVCSTGDVQIQNMSKLITKYSEYCGSDSLCSVSDNRSHSKITELHNCPSCSCSEDCDYVRNCCVDESYTSCVPTTVPFTQNGVQMVSFCPDTYDTAYENCLQPITGNNFLAQIPVYSLTTSKSYVNAQCSKCHGENDTISWRYYISCPRLYIDVDYYTDEPSLWNEMMQSDCTLTLTPPVNTFQRQCEVNSLIKTCNITGEWDVYDKEIEDACTHYRKPYGLYENIFCLLCNTGKNQRYDFSFKKIESKEKSKLFKIVCNYTKCLMPRNGIGNESFDNPATHFEQILQYDDAVIRLFEDYNATTGKYIANITFLSVNLTKSINNILTDNNILNKSSDYEAAVNLTALYEEYVRSGGYRNWCLEDHRVDKIFPGFKARRDCSCDDNCYKSASCCPDAAYFQRSACSAAYIRNPAAFGFGINSPYYFMIRKCPLHYRYRSIKLKCESYNKYDLLNTPIINLESNDTYYNIYCYLCHNQKDLTFPNLTNIKIWDVSLVCPTVFIPTFKSSIEAVLQTAFSKRCLVLYSTTLEDKMDICNPENFKSIGKCNTTGVMKTVSDSARYMCENIYNIMAKSRNLMYKNQICDLCNSKVFEEPISNCYTLLSNSTSEDIYNCENGTLDEQLYPYKNIYCEICNRIHSSISKVDDFSNQVSLRDIFYMPEGNVYISKKQDKECSITEFKDTYKNKCRQLLCPRGKLLRNDTCLHFIPYARKVQYNIALKVLISSNFSDIKFHSVVENLQEILQQEINKANIYTGDEYDFSSVSCTYQFVEQFSDIYLLYFQVSMENDQFPIDRNRLEMHLLGLTNVTISFKGVFLTFQQSLDAWFLPTVDLPNKFVSNGCFMKSGPGSSTLAYNINDLLVCPQIELSEDEYVFSEGYTSIYVKSVDRRYNINEFVRGSGGSARICVNSYTRKLEVFARPDQKTLVEIGLTVVTFICTLISLLFLLATILIYCMFSELRTLPGKNIMCYAFSLFLAQLFFIIRAYIANEIACAWIGGFTHYFWMAVFTCTNVCCLHMFRLFVRNALTHGDVSAEGRLFIKYCLASLLLPLIPVTLNIILSHTEIESMKFGYGGSKCFLLSQKALILMFILPIFLQIIFNIVMFSITFHYIRNTPKVKSTQDRHDFSIFLKLFLLTGVSWLFSILDIFFDVSPFTFLATIVNGAQGVVIFVSFICNKRVFKLLKNKHGQLMSRSSKSVPSSTTNHTTTTHL